MENVGKRTKISIKYRKMSQLEKFYGYIKKTSHLLLGDVGSHFFVGRLWNK